MASEPSDSNFPSRVKQKAYPAREAGGFVWCYMGPPQEMTEFEPPAFAPTPDCRVSATKVRVRCNWAQILEGQINSAHSSSLHSSDMVPAQVDGAKATDSNWLRPSNDKAPRFQVERTSYGFRYAAIRRPIMNEATHEYIRTTVYIAPYTALIPPNNVHNVATLLTPEDDHTTMFYFIAWNGPDKPGIDADAGANSTFWNGARTSIASSTMCERRTISTARIAVQWLPAISPASRAFPNQDIAMWESMGPITDRSKERVGVSDIAVNAFRRLMVDAARSIATASRQSAQLSPHSACKHQLVRGRGAKNNRLAHLGKRQRKGRPLGLSQRRSEEAKPGRIRCRVKFAAGVLALAVSVTAAQAEDTIKLAIGQRGNWDTSISEIGQRVGIFKKQAWCSTWSIRRAPARPSRRSYPAASTSASPAASWAR